MLSEPTLGVSLLVIKGGTLKQSNQELRNWGVKEMDEGAETEVHYLVHEVVHLVMHIFTDRGIPINCDNEEIFAYHVDYWTQVIMEEIKVTERP